MLHIYAAIIIAMLAAIGVTATVAYFYHDYRVRVMKVDAINALRQQAEESFRAGYRRGQVDADVERMKKQQRIDEMKAKITLAA